MSSGPLDSDDLPDAWLSSRCVVSADYVSSAVVTVSVVIVESLPKVSPFSVPIVVKEFFVKDILLVLGLSIVVSLPSPIGERSIVFGSCSAVLGIGFYSFIFFSYSLRL